MVIVIGIRILPAARHRDRRHIARTLDVGIRGRRAVRILYGREIAVIVVGIHIVERFAEELRAVEPRFVPVVLIDERIFHARIVAGGSELTGEELPVMHVLIHGDVARSSGGRAVIERYRNARPARVVRPGLHGRAVQRNGRRLRPAAEREDIPRRAGDRHRLRIPLRDHPLARQVQRVRIQSAASLPCGVFHVHRSVCAACCRAGPCAGDVCGDVAVREEVDVVHERDRLGRVPDLHRYGRGVPCPVRALEAGARKQLVGAIRGAFVLCVPPIQRLSRAVVHRRRVAEVVELVDDVPPEVVRHLRRVVAVGECERRYARVFGRIRKRRRARGAGGRARDGERIAAAVRVLDVRGGGHDVRAVPSVRYALPVMIGDGGEVARRGIRIRHRLDGVRTRAGIGELREAAVCVGEGIVPPRAVREGRNAAAVRRDAYGVPVGVLYGGELSRGRELHGVALLVRDGVSAVGDRQGIPVPQLVLPYAVRGDKVLLRAVPVRPAVIARAGDGACLDALRVVAAPAVAVSNIICSGGETVAEARRGAHPAAAVAHVRAAEKVVAREVLHIRRARTAEALGRVVPALFEAARVDVEDLQLGIAVVAAVFLCVVVIPAVGALVHGLYHKSVVELSGVPPARRAGDVEDVIAHAPVVVELEVERRLVAGGLIVPGDFRIVEPFGGGDRIDAALERAGDLGAELAVIVQLGAYNDVRAADGGQVIDADERAAGAARSGVADDKIIRIGIRVARSGSSDIAVLEAGGAEHGIDRGVERHGPAAHRVGKPVMVRAADHGIFAGV